MDKNLDFNQFIEQSNLADERKELWITKIIPRLTPNGSKFLFDYLKNYPDSLEVLTNKLSGFQTQLQSQGESAISEIVDDLIAEVEKQERIKKTQKDLRRLLVKYRIK